MSTHSTIAAGPIDLDLLDGDVLDRLRPALRAADYTVGAVTDLLGGAAHAALLRDATVPGLRATGAEQVAGTALATLTRLWPLQAAVASSAADRALPGLVEPLAAAGVLVRSAGEVRAAVDLRPYGDDRHDWWVVSDLTPGLDGTDRRVAPDHVLGVSPASTTLAQLTVRRPVAAALDLGTGCGVQSLHLGTHAERVVGTDVNSRALAMARLTTRLAERPVGLRSGSLWEPAGDRLYDLVVTNPPFVVSPATDQQLIYRDSGLPGDEVVRRIVTGAPAHLAPNGWCQVLANWVHARGEPWAERVGGWLAGTGCDAWVLQREVLDPAEYVEMWLADAGLSGQPEWGSRYDSWLSWMDDEGVEAVGMGWLCLHRTDRAQPTLRIEDWPYAIEQPVGAEVAAWADRAAALADLGDDALLAARLVRAGDVVQETYGEPGASDPARIVLRRTRGVQRARPVDTVEAAMLGACDGDLTLGQVLAALTQLLGAEGAAFGNEQVTAVRELLAEGWLTVPWEG
ncbi:class I SAM-dependent methyltransferase [soil metagenome]